MIFINITQIRSGKNRIANPVYTSMLVFFCERIITELSRFRIFHLASRTKKLVFQFTIMGLKKSYLFVIVCSCLFSLGWSETPPPEGKFGKISDCQAEPWGYYVKLICGDKCRDDILVEGTHSVKCRQTKLDAEWLLKVIFENCHFPELKEYFVTHFKNVTTYNITSVSLETLPKAFRTQKSIEHIMASHNKLTKIPAQSFSSNLKVLDLRQNLISTIDPLAFDGADSLEELSLADNLISDETVPTFNISSLVLLDLSGNPLGNLKVGLFAYLSNLKHLNLARTGIADIELGALSHQPKLVTLNLSENSLKKLDFANFLPIFRDLKVLNLDHNILPDLNGFKQKLFPRLNYLDIRHNQYNCSYLLDFLKSIKSEKIILPLDPTETDIGKTSIGGINCKPVA